MVENTPVLEELIQLRHEHATILGYPNHAAYITELRMAKTYEAVATFLAELGEKLRPLWRKEKDIMLKFKEEEVYWVIPID